MYVFGGYAYGAGFRKNLMQFNFSNLYANFFFFVVDFFHSETATWSIVQPLVDGDQPAPRRKHDSVVVGDKLYVFGGKGATNYFNDLWVFDFGTT
jgi:hypothetical protein